MTSYEFSKLMGRLMRHPSAPYHEHAVRGEVETICAELGLDFERDRFGNVIARLITNPRARPLVLAAHMDHPGFEVVRRLGEKRLLLRFLGGVSDPYFRPGVPVRLMPGAIPAKLGKRVGKAKEFEVTLAKTPETELRFAVWELDDFSARNGIIRGRHCDDLGGVASILGTMAELKSSRARVNVIGVISRAEEIGFLGAMTIATANGLPENSFVISLETSRELPGVKMGRGVIIRVGDKTSMFNPEATRFLTEVAKGLQAKNKKFQFQRGLMSGGTCEATAYQEFGFQTTAACVALGNYHNCGQNSKIQPEYINASDACSMVDLLVAAARELPRYPQIIENLPKRLRKMERAARKRLLATA